jgi:hypothetical protein
VDHQSANHSDDQKNGGKNEKHAHLRIGFDDLTPPSGSGDGRPFSSRRPHADIRVLAGALGTELLHGGASDVLFLD